VTSRLAQLDGRGAVYHDRSVVEGKEWNTHAIRVLEGLILGGRSGS
jgi:hypothetical protein